MVKIYLPRVKNQNLYLLGKNLIELIIFINYIYKSDEKYNKSYNIPVEFKKSWSILLEILKYLRFIKNKKMRIYIYKVIIFVVAIFSISINSWIYYP